MNLLREGRISLQRAPIGALHSHEMEATTKVLELGHLIYPC